MAVPETLDWGPGLVTVTVCVMRPGEGGRAGEAAASVALTVTESDPAVVGVPVMAPWSELMDSPAGRPVADQEERVAVDEESVAGDRRG